MTTGEKITECRKRKNMTQNNLADELGVTRQAVSRWESDLAFPETDNLIKMSKIFECSVDWLLNYNEERVANNYSEKNKDKNFCEFFKGLYFEYKSKKMIGNLPLVHINIGLGRVAKGFFSVGLVSVGVISIGLISLGLLAIGTVGLGFISLCALAAGVFSAGAVSIGAIALGGLAIGLFSLGGASIGLFAFGGYANGYFIGIGGWAVGKIAVGGTNAVGEWLSISSGEYSLKKDEFYEYCNNIPEIWSMFVDWCKSLYAGVVNGIITLNG